MARILKATVLIFALGISGIAHAGDTAKGKSVYTSQCAICHAVVAHAPAGIGPSLYGVIGRQSGSMPGYSYSSAMKGAAVTWTPARVEAYIANPAKNIPGNKMPYAGLKNPGQAEDLTAYLATLK